MTRPDSATDRVTALLRTAILSGELEVGSLHSIYQMAERFEVSPLPSVTQCCAWPTLDPDPRPHRR